MSAVLFAACIVIGVSDGDGVRVKCPGHKAAFSVRVNQIDAPEVQHGGFIKIDEQPFGIQSRDALRALCLGNTATVRRVGFDRDQRPIGDVKCGDVDVADYQVRAGLAWAYTPYLVKGSPLPALEAVARAEKRGLWSVDGAVPPWQWRKKGASC